jgi:BolA protein
MRPEPVSREALDAALRSALQPTRLEIRDDSHLHAGHAGAREGKHFSVIITSAQFSGCNRVARHRLVYDALRMLMPAGIHALAIEARSPDEP